MLVLRLPLMMLSFPPDVAHHYDDVLADFDLFNIMLRPDVTKTKRRNKNRKLDVTYQPLENIIEPIYDHFASFNLQELVDFGWCILDSSQDSIETSVAKIMDWSQSR